MDSYNRYHVDYTTGCRDYRLHHYRIYCKYHNAMDKLVKWVNFWLYYTQIKNSPLVKISGITYFTEVLWVDCGKLTPENQVGTGIFYDPNAKNHLYLQGCIIYKSLLFVAFTNHYLEYKDRIEEGQFKFVGIIN
jgi:hypothetical protein